MLCQYVIFSKFLYIEKEMLIYHLEIHIMNMWSEYLVTFGTKNLTDLKVQ